MGQFNLKLLHVFAFSILVVSQAGAQNSLVGDGFGGRLWYTPTNYNVGSYSGYFICDNEGGNHLIGWGSNSKNQLGLGYSESGSPIPIEIPSMSNVKYFSCGYLMGAIKNDNAGWVWGSPSLGSGTLDGFYSTPYEIISNAKFIDACSNSVSFVKHDGTVWSVGFNHWGKFGDGSIGTAFDSTLVQMNIVNNGVRVACNPTATCVLLSDSSIVSVGSGAIGLGVDITSTTTPLPISGLPKVIDIKSHSFETIALAEDGDVYFWGYIEAKDSMVYSPLKIDQLENIVAISGCDDGKHFLALDENKNCYAWGNNFHSQCGVPNGGIIYYYDIQLIATDVIDIMAGETFSYIVKSDNTLWAVGESSDISIWLDLEDFERNQFAKITPEKIPGWCGNNSELPMNVNVFSPNNDGHNDVFYFPYDGIEQVEFTILNRWGNVIKTINSPSEFWDGKTESGNMCSEGTYFFVGRYSVNGLDWNKFHGHVTLIR